MGFQSVTVPAVPPTRAAMYVQQASAIYAFCGEIFARCTQSWDHDAADFAVRLARRMQRLERSFYAVVPGEEHGLLGRVGLGDCDVAIYGRRSFGLQLGYLFN